MRLADDSYWRYDYDTLGQVVSGRKYWRDGSPVEGQQFEYAFDDIGNRTGTKAGGDTGGAGLRPASYSVNDLNQYPQRDVPGMLDILGVARGTVTVNGGGGVHRQGEYFRKKQAPLLERNPMGRILTAPPLGRGDAPHLGGRRGRARRSARAVARRPARLSCITVVPSRCAQSAAVLQDRADAVARFQHPAALAAAFEVRRGAFCIVGKSRQRAGEVIPTVVSRDRPEKADWRRFRLSPGVFPAFIKLALGLLRRAQW